MRLGTRKDFIAVAVILGIAWLVAGVGEDDGAGQAEAERRFTEADLYISDNTRPYVDRLVAGVNRLARENQLCRDELDPGSVGLSSRGTASEPVFFVHCGSGSDVRTVHFE